MKAIGFDRYGGPDMLEVVEIPDPEPGPRDIVVRVKAAGVNPVDAKVRARKEAGSPVEEPPLVPGWDAAGTVEYRGEQARRFEVGDAVYFAGDITRPGTYAELVAVDERIVARKPETLSFEQAAGVPLTALTAWEALFEHMPFSPNGDSNDASVLIVGGAGGVGSIAVQLAKKLAGTHVIATASRTESAKTCLELGADAVIDHTKDLAKQLKESGYDGVDCVLNTATPSNLPELIALLNPLGTICCITGGPTLKALDVTGLFPKRGSLTFEYMFARPLYGAEPERQGAVLQRIASLIDERVLSHAVRHVMDWAEAPMAHRAIETGHTIGKIVLRVNVK
jgi:zinc-binding alcohol dehydrogenase family protein